MSDPISFLERLVAFPSVCQTSNGEIISFAQNHLEALGASVTLLPGPESDRSNLFATFGPRDVPGYILSAHVDVVPAAGQSGWTGDPFILRERQGRFIGRGAADMKGFIAAVFSALSDLPKTLSRPLHIALSYDEEIGCVGVRHMIARLPELCAPPLGCIVGEPSDMQPVLRHKGKASGRVTLSGRSGHSSRPDLGDNAIHLAAELVIAIRDLSSQFAAEGPFHAAFEPSTTTLQVGVIGGGSAVNIVPEACQVDWEVRAVPGIDPMAVYAAVELLVERILAPHRAAGRAVGATCDLLSAYPALDLSEDSALCRLASRISGHAARGAVSYGTEAGLFQASGVPSIICGPGSITEAHRPDESIARADLDACHAALLRLFAELS